MFIVIACVSVCDVINSEIYLSSLIIPFSHITKKVRTKMAISKIGIHQSKSENKNVNIFQDEMRILSFLKSFHCFLKGEGPALKLFFRKNL